MCRFWTSWRQSWHRYVCFYAICLPTYSNKFEIHGRERQRWHCLLGTELPPWQDSNNIVLTWKNAFIWQIEHDQGGEYQDGREALERLKTQMKKNSAQSEAKSVSSQIETIRDQLASLDAKVNVMSQSARDMVSFVAHDAIETLLQGSSESAQDKET